MRHKEIALDGKTWVIVNACGLDKTRQAKCYLAFDRNLPAPQPIVMIYVPFAQRRT